VNHGLTLPADGDEVVEGQERFPELVGSLMYLMVCTRPDLAHVLSVLGRFVGSGRHSGKHWKAALRVLGYAVHTKKLRLTLGGSESVLEGFTDASWADNQDDRKSSQGYCFTLGKGVISWKGTRSPTVALSSCEAELYGGTSAAQELLWLKRLLQQSKHIEARYFFIRELVEGKEIKVSHIKGEDNPADVFTKPLSVDRHLRMVELLGLR